MCEKKIEDILLGRPISEGFFVSPKSMNLLSIELKTDDLEYVKKKKTSLNLINIDFCIFPSKIAQTIEIQEQVEAVHTDDDDDEHESDQIQPQEPSESFQQAMEHNSNTSNGASAELPSSIDAQEMTYEGWLRKEGGRRKTIKRRWFVLDAEANNLSYHVSPGVSIEQPWSRVWLFGCFVFQLIFFSFS
jgi:hypothetical protein